MFPEIKDILFFSFFSIMLHCKMNHWWYWRFIADTGANWWWWNHTAKTTCQRTWSAGIWIVTGWVSLRSITYVPTHSNLPRECSSRNTPVRMQFRFTWFADVHCTFCKSRSRNRTHPVQFLYYSSSFFYLSLECDSHSSPLTIDCLRDLDRYSAWCSYQMRFSKWREWKFFKLQMLIPQYQSLFDIDSKILFLFVFLNFQFSVKISFQSLTIFSAILYRFVMGRHTV